MAQNKTRSKTSASKKVSKKLTSSHGRATIKATFNNTHVNIADASGNTLTVSSSGQMGFNGARKSTPFASQVAAEKAATIALSYGLKSVDVFVHGPGPGRESSIRAIAAAGISVLSITDTTGVPHNGCRAKKRRRI